MGLRSDWDALAGRIEGLAEAARFLLSTVATAGHSDRYNVISEVILPSADGVVEALAEYLAAHGASLPPHAASAVRSFVNDRWPRGFKGRMQGVRSFSEMQAAVALLQGVRAEVSFFLADTQYAAHHLVERAFLHLNRSIVVDEALGKRWREAFKQHETYCERLGAVHLLSHGLWAFKASGIGAATDLVLGQPLPPNDRTEAAAVAMVLTEWKRVQRQEDVGSVAADAREQAQKYAGGVLGGMELRSYRYVVVVSAAGMDMPEDVKLNGVTYRHVNVATAPRVPSARQPRARSGK